MTDFLPLAQSISLVGFLVCTMLSLGLSLAVHEITEPLGDIRLLVLTLVLNFVLAPAFAWLITLLIPLRHGHAAGLLLLGGAAGAPFLPNLARVARLQVPLAVASVVLLTAGSTIFIPVALPLMIPSFTASAASIASPLLLLILSPLAAGMVIKGVAGRFAALAAPTLANLGSLGLALLSLVLAVRFGPAMLEMLGSGAIAANLLLIWAVLAAGWLLGALKPEVRGVLCLGGASRNFGAAFVPAAGFSDPSVTLMLTLGAVITLVTLFPLSAWVSRHPMMAK
jgi:BASS family bile acid:Na+ symporter